MDDQCFFGRLAGGRTRQKHAPKIVVEMDRPDKPTINIIARLLPTVSAIFYHQLSLPPVGPSHPLSLGHPGSYVDTNPRVFGFSSMPL